MVQPCSWMEVSKLRFKSLLQWLYSIVLFIITSYLFYPSVLYRFWMINDFSVLMGCKIALTGLIAVIGSTFILEPIVLKGLERIEDDELSAILEKIAFQYHMNKTPGIYQIRTSQTNAIAYWMANKPCIGLSSGLWEAYQAHAFDDQDITCILAHLLTVHRERIAFKRNLMLGIAGFYNLLGAVFLISGRGFSRLAKITGQQASSIFASMTGITCILIGNLFRIPAKLSSILALPLIYSFQKDADQAAGKVAGFNSLRKTIQKIIEYNEKIDKELSILSEPEYWFIKPAKLLWIDRILLVRPSVRKRIDQLSSY